MSLVVCHAVQCENMVDMYGPLIVHLIATGYTPEQVCKVQAFPIFAFVFDKYISADAVCINDQMTICVENVETLRNLMAVKEMS